jgi:hypothetical protein
MSRFGLPRLSDANHASAYLPAPNMRIGRLPVILILAALAATTPLPGQSDRGTVTGTVSDPAGALVPAAALTLTHTGTAAAYDTVTTGTGNYTLPSLPAGRYNLKVTAPGFSQYIQEGIEVQVAQTARVDVVLRIGQSTDSVTIVADAPLLRTENAEQSQTINGDDIDKLPLTLGGNNLYGTRNPLAGLSLAPGVAQVTGTNFQFRTNGSTDTARFLLDGQDMTTAGMTSQHLSESHPSVEAVSEVTLQSSNFAAEFGQVQGGLVNFTTRSGTNQLHGAAYDYNTNEFMNAGRPFTNDGKGHLIRPRQRNNDYGFSVGGPVFIPRVYNGRNKTFFFFNFDQFRNKSTVSGSAATVPTAAYRQGDFSSALTGRILTDPQGRQYQENSIFDPLSNTVVNGQTIRTQFQGNAIPQSRLDPVALKIQALIPMPTGPGNTNNLAVVDSVASTTTLPSLKMDHNIGANNKVSFFWTEWINNVPKSTGDGVPFPISNTRSFITHSNTERLTFDRTVTPTLLVHLGVGYLRYAHVDSSPDISQNYDAPGKLGYLGGVKNAKGNTGFPGMTGLSAAQGGFLTGNGSSLGWTNGVYDWDDKPTATGSATLVRGNHTYKAGGEWHKDIWTFKNLVGAGSNAFNAAETAQPYLNSTSLGGGTLGFPYASFLLGAADSGSVHPVSDPQVRKWAWSMYAQDTWKVTRKLTIDYGVRWDYQTGWHELHSRSSSFAAGIANPAAGNLLGATAYEGSGTGRCNCSFTRTYPFAIGPRLGVAWQIDSKTVIRAGWGLVYGQTPVLSYFTTATVGVGFNTLSFANSSGLFGDPAYYLKDGLKYDPAALYAATYDPGVRPQPGTINSPPSYLSPQGGRPPRINQWNIAIQRELIPNLSLEAAYVGNRSVWILANNSVELNALSPQMVAARGFDITNATDQTILNGSWTAPAAAARGIKAPYAGYPTALTAAQTLRPYPQFGNIGVQWMDNGDSWYDALQMKLTKRYSRGLQLVGSFSWQKELEYGINVPNNVYNTGVNKTISAYSQPLTLATGFSYQSPAPHWNRFVNSILRDWTVGGFFSYSSGLPIESPIGQNNLQNVLFQSNNTSINSGQNSSTSSSGTFMNRVLGQPLFLKDPNCHCIDPNKEFVLNPAAWSNPAVGTFGTAAAYYNDYRFQRHPGEQLSFGRLFKIREQMSLQLRIEFFNVFNRANMADPISVNALATQSRNAGVPTAGFGYINSQSLGNGSTLNNNTGLGGNPRQGQALLRFQF